MSNSILSRFVLGAFGSIALLFGASAHASQPIPDGAWTASSQLNVTTASDIGTTCDTDASGDATAANNSGTVDTMDFSGNFICNVLVSANNLPYGISVSSNHQTLTFTNVDVDTSVGNCSGDVAGSWTSSSAGAGTLTFASAPLGSCSVNGEMGVSW